MRVRSSAQRSLDSIDKLLTDCTRKLNRAPHEVSPPYPWSVLPARYRQLRREFMNSPEEGRLWYEHVCVLSIPYSDLNSAVSKNAESPDAPILLRLDKKNNKADDFYEISRRIGRILVKPAGTPGDTARALVGSLYLIGSSDTQEATGILDKLPPLPPSSSDQEQRLVRILARTLLRWGTGKPPTPVRKALEGLRLIDTRKSDDIIWEWGLILIYSCGYSLFHEDYGLKEAEPEFFETSLKLLGRSLEERTEVPSEVHPRAIETARLTVFDAALAGIKQYSQEIMGGASKPTTSDVVTGINLAKWLILAVDPTRERELGPLWFTLYRRWFAPLHDLSSKDSGGALDKTSAGGNESRVGSALGDLVRAVDKRLAVDKSGALAACAAVLADLNKDSDRAASLVKRSRTLAQTHPFTHDDEEILEFIDSLGNKIGHSE